MVFKERLFSLATAELFETITLKHRLMFSSISTTWIWTLSFSMRQKKKWFDSTGFYHQWTIRDISTALSFQQPVLEMISALKCVINIKRDVKSISGIDHCGIMCFQLSVTLADSDRCLMTNIGHYGQQSVHNFIKMRQIWVFRWHRRMLWFHFVMKNDRCFYNIIGETNSWQNSTENGLIWLQKSWTDSSCNLIIKKPWMHHVSVGKLMFLLYDDLV